MDRARALEVTDLQLAPHIRTLAEWRAERALAAVKAASETKPVVVATLEACLKQARSEQVPAQSLTAYVKVLTKSRAEQQAALSAVEAASKPSPVVVQKLDSVLSDAVKIGVPSPSLEPYADILATARAEQTGALAAVRAASEAVPVVVSILDQCLVNARAVGVDQALLDEYVSSSAATKKKQDAALAAVKEAAENKPIAVKKLEGLLSDAKLIGVPSSSLDPYDGELAAAREEQAQAVAAVQAASKTLPLNVSELDECLARARTVGADQSLLDEFVTLLAVTTEKQQAALSAVEYFVNEKPVNVKKLDGMLSKARAIGVPMPSLAQYGVVLSVAKGFLRWSRLAALTSVRAASQREPLDLRRLERRLTYARNIGVAEPLLQPYADAHAAAKAKEGALSAVKAAAEARPIPFRDLESLLSKARQVQVAEPSLEPYARVLATVKAALAAVQSASEAKPIVVASLAECLTRARTAGVAEAELQKYVQLLATTKADEERQTAQEAREREQEEKVQELKKRLEREAEKRGIGNVAKFGELTVSLMWNNRVDRTLLECVTRGQQGQTADGCVSIRARAAVDLSVYPPSGRRLYYGDRDHSGGHLDVDMNYGRNVSDTPCENIYFDAAANGSYRVAINKQDTPFTVVVQQEGVATRHIFEGLHTEVCTFEYVGKGRELQNVKAAANITYFKDTAPPAAAQSSS